MSIHFQNITPNLMANNVNKTVEVIKTLKVSFYGATEFVIKDLNGYYLMFAETKKQ